MIILWMFLTAVVALIYARSILIWTFVAYVIGPWALLLTLLGPKKGAWERRALALNAFKEGIEEVTRPEEYKDFETVDDLMKQLDKK
jgi:hypothetical protein